MNFGEDLSFVFCFDMAMLCLGVSIDPLEMSSWSGGVELLLFELEDILLFSFRAWYLSPLWHKM